jgi:two-component system, response regulator YesN
MYKVLIADDERLVREDVKNIISEGDLPLELVGEAKNGQEALDMVEETYPDIVITDIRMPLMNGIDLIKNIRMKYSDIKFIIISGHAEFEYAREALSLGVMDYILKPLENAKITRVIMKVCKEIDKMKGVESELRNNFNYNIEKYLNNLIFNYEHKAGSWVDIVQMIPDLEKEYYSLIIIHGVQPELRRSEFIKEEYDMERFDAGNMIRELCSVKMILFNNLRDKTEILIVTHASAGAEVIRQNNIFVNNCFLKINKGMGIPITSGISNCFRGAENLQKSYKEAKYAVNMRFINGNNNIYRYSDVEVLYKREYKTPERKLKALEIGLHHIESSAVLPDISKTVKDIFSHDGIMAAGAGHVQMLYMDVIKAIMHYCECYNINIFDFIDEKVVYGENIGDFNSKTDIEEYVLILMIKIIEARKSKHSDTRLLIKEVEKYIEKHFQENISFTGVAKQYRVNSTYLSRVFKTVTGKSLSRYLEDIRIDTARLLLEQSDNAIQEISSSVGYTDNQYFHRVFKKGTGMTPNEYRIKKRQELQ